MAKIGDVLYKCKTNDGEIFFMQGENDSIMVFYNTSGHVPCRSEISIQKYKTVKELSKYLKECPEGKEAVFGGLRWDIPEKTYVIGAGKIKAKNCGISIDGHVEKITANKIKKSNYIELSSALVLYFEEGGKIEKARGIINTNIAKDRKSKRS